MSRSPVFIILWVPQIDDRMPVIWDDAPGAQIRDVSHGPRAVRGSRGGPGSVRQAQEALAQSGPREAAKAARSAAGRANR
jgi:hypothetical protein